MNEFRKARSLGKRAPRRTLMFGDHGLSVQTVTSPEQLRKGLSGIRALPSNTGMLFVMPSVGPVHFWMRDTHIPLDIAFLDENMRVLSIHTMEPETGAARHDGPVKYAVETNAGWFRGKGVKSGDIVGKSNIGGRVDRFVKVAKKESTFRKALPVAAATAAPLLLNTGSLGLVSLPILAGLGSVITQREDASLPFVAPIAGAFGGGRAGAYLARKGMVGRAVREGMPGLPTRMSRVPLSRIVDMARRNPKTLGGALVLGGSALGGALGAHLGNK